MEEPVEELEPLFDYSRVQPIDLISDDDDNLEAFPVAVSGKRKKVDNAGERKGKVKYDVVNLDEDDDCGVLEREKEKEEDWLAPPPKIMNTISIVEDNFIQELRLKKQELASLAQSADTVFKAVTENARREANSLSKPSVESGGEQGVKLSKQKAERQKIVISIQDKDENKQYRIYKDDKLEKLFKMYAEKTNTNMESLVFSFDGDKVNPSVTPEILGLEDDDMIEVHCKSH